MRITIIYGSGSQTCELSREVIERAYYAFNFDQDYYWNSIYYERPEYREKYEKKRDEELKDEIGWLYKTFNVSEVEGRVYLTPREGTIYFYNGEKCCMNGLEYYAKVYMWKEYRELSKEEFLEEVKYV